MFVEVGIMLEFNSEFFLILFRVFLNVSRVLCSNISNILMKGYLYVCGSWNYA